jgi:acyl transferase domain-containing protein
LPDVLRGALDAPSLDRVDVYQPTLFSVMVSLAQLRRSYGVAPAAVVGHSIGEFAAACVAGALSLEDGAKVSVSWGRAQATLAGKGEMVSVLLPANRVSARLRQWADRLTIAAINGACSVVVSGDCEAAEGLLAELTVDGVRARKVCAGYAAHSAQIRTVREGQLADLATITARSGATPFYSSVTGGLFDTAGLDAGYWYRNQCETVRFEEATRAAATDGYSAFIEVSPHPVLTLGIGQTLETVHDDAVVVDSIVRHQGSLDRFIRSVAEAYVGGVAVDWTAAFSGVDARRVNLPSVGVERGSRSHGSPDLFVALHRRLCDLSDVQRRRVMLDLVLDETATVTGVSVWAESVRAWFFGTVGSTRPWPSNSVTAFVLQLAYGFPLRSSSTIRHRPRWRSICSHGCLEWK